MNDPLPAAILAGTSRARSPGFLLALAAITLVPLIGVPIAFGWSSLTGGGIVPGSAALIAITGSMHVGSTSFFYFDRAFEPVLRQQPVRCLWSLGWLPVLLLTLGVGGAALAGPWAFLLIFAFHNTWLFYHYQRQNFGLISFVSTHVGYGRLPAAANTALNVAALGAILSLLGTPGFYPNAEGLVSAQTLSAMRIVGTLVYVGSLYLMARVFWNDPRLLADRWLKGSLLLGVGFFLPSIVFQSAALAFFPYAIAHGAQYILMMSVVSGRSARGWAALATMCGLGVVAGLGLDAMNAWPAVLVKTALVQVHFLVDAKVWRLREPLQRAIMNSRFDFLLSR